MHAVTAPAQASTSQCFAPTIGCISLTCFQQPTLSSHCRLQLSQSQPSRRAALDTVSTTKTDGCVTT
eukprot:1156268-Pelagomonas_calceolata.AAC.4